MASLLVLGLLLASRIAMPGWAGAALAGFFALFHGAAHGAELPAGHSAAAFIARSEEHTSELQSLMRISYAVFCLKKKQKTSTHTALIISYERTFVRQHT